MLSNQIMELFSNLAILFPAFLITFTFRGFFKSWIANLMGDSTAKDNGFLSLNPLVHVDFFNLSIILFVFVFIGGLFSEIFPKDFLFIFLILLGVRWTVQAPINEFNFKKYKLGIIFTSFAASFGSFLLCLIFMYLIKFFPYRYFNPNVTISFMQIFKTVIDFTMFFGVLDLLPIPPFDAGRILEFILPKNLSYIYEWLCDYSLYIIFFLFFCPFINELFFSLINVIIFFVESFLASLVF